MHIYVTRHGQVAEDTEYFDDNAALPKGEVPLSALGREQATRLGKFLAKQNFRGAIYASPLVRTMETAELIAEHTGSAIYPTHWMREYFGDQEFISAYRGLTVDELKAQFPHVAEDAILPYPWWSQTPDTVDGVRDRVIAAIDNLLAERGDTDEEILLVGHGKTAGAANIYLDLKRSGILWNCCVGMYDSKNQKNSYGKNIDFLPGQIVSSNKNMALDYKIPEDSLTPFAVTIPEKVITTKDFKILHIGDTHSATYAFYKHLIRLVKPNVIIHTGDTANEDKVSRDRDAVEPYLMKVKMLADILKEANCPVYWVPGNNDLPDEVARIAPYFHIVQPDSLLTIKGLTMCLAHSRDQFTKKAEFYLYGHGKTEKTYVDECRCMGEGTHCLNAEWSISVITLPQREIHHIENPC